jgi:hypothetical protein
MYLVCVCVYILAFICYSLTFIQAPIGTASLVAPVLQLPKYRHSLPEVNDHALTMFTRLFFLLSKPKPATGSIIADSNDDLLILLDQLDLPMYSFDALQVFLPSLSGLVCFIAATDWNSPLVNNN